MDSLRKNTQIEKKNRSNQSLDEGDIVDLKSALLLENFAIAGQLPCARVGKGKVFLRLKAMGQVKKVGIIANNLYRLEVDGISTELPTIGKCMKDMQLMLEREQVLHASGRNTCN